MSYQPADSTTANETSQPLPVKKTKLDDLSEDIWAIIIGSIVIVTILALTIFVTGFTLPLPGYQWQNSSDLVNKVLSGKNILLIIQTGLIFLLLSGLAIRLSGGSLKNYAAGFVIVYLLAITALIVEGNSAITYYGLEYVVFA
ncbi:hypothetical protein, partial [Longitalea arenae]|uniref:hypothetical protein n=1 Tax=Longitalea arenae TaxID=2812558 RepID=UPI00196793EE